MPIDPRYKVSGAGLKRDVRPWGVRFAESAGKSDNLAATLAIMALILVFNDFLPVGVSFSWAWAFTDLLIIIAYVYFRWFSRRPIRLPFKHPTYSKYKDPNNPPPGKSSPGNPEGVLFLGNVRDGPSKGEELWLTNSDARTHILLLGTTGAGKTEALKALATNALAWGSGFIYVDGKAQNTLWGDIYSMARRFGRDDDLLVLNYMTGNVDGGSQSNSLNPFSIGSSSYLTQMMVSMMDDSGDDNAMWKGRAISLLSALMPALTFKRDNMGLMMDVGVIRDHLTMEQIIKMSRDPALPDRIIRGLQSYLDTLPGYVDSAFDDEGKERPQSPDQPIIDLSQTRQQHGYLTMQFTRSLQSLADEYGYIFKQQMADIDMMDVVLNRRILVVLIPALEKSPDEAANLGKIVVAALKGMMGATLGASIEGSKETMLDNNPTESKSPFITIFDEVGYYTSPGMGVMAAQARSLGFSLVFASQDLPAMQKRVKEEAMSITGNCNLKIFGKLEDPTETKDFFEKTVATALVSEVSGFSAVGSGLMNKSFGDSDNISVQSKKEAGYDDLRRQTMGQMHFLWADKVISGNFFFANPPKVGSVRVQRFLPVSSKNWVVENRDNAAKEVASRLKAADWTAEKAGPKASPVREINLMAEAYASALKADAKDPMAAAMAALQALVTTGKSGPLDVVPPTVGVAAGDGNSYWPLGGAVDVAVPPAGEGGSPMAAPAPSTPSWMLPAGGGATSAATPAASTPAWMGGAPAPSAVPPAPAGSMPPWMGGGSAAATPASPPPWMGGAPAVAAAPVAPAPAGTAPLPPWAGGGFAPPPVAPALPTPPVYTPPPGGAAPGWAGYPPPPAAPVTPGYPPGYGLPPSQQQPAAGTYAPVPLANPLPPAMPTADSSPEIDAILRAAAENLAAEMFPQGKN